MLAVTPLTKLTTRQKAEREQSSQYQHGAVDVTEELNAVHTDRLTGHLNAVLLSC
jgi:hypothetical protein